MKYIVFIFSLIIYSSSYAGCSNPSNGDLPTGATDSFSSTLENINNLSDRGRILVCKTDGINDQDTTLSLTRLELTGVANDESIPIGNAISSSPIANPITMTGGTPIPTYSFQNLNYSRMPTAVSGKQYLYHFYYQCRYNWNGNITPPCQPNRKNWLREALRKNTNIFIVAGATGTPYAINHNSRLIVKFTNVELTNVSDSSKKILADITYRYAELGSIVNSAVKPKGFYHFGVYAEIKPITNPTSSIFDIKRSGNYQVSSYINKNNFTTHRWHRY